MTMTQSLLDFILNLLSDGGAKAAFLADPERALADAGLSDVCGEDVSDAMSYVAEYHPVSFVGAREYTVGNNAVAQHATSGAPEGPRGEWHGDWHGDPHASAVQQLEYITNNYSYADSHDTVIDKSVNQTVWNKGVLAQSFDDHSVTAADHSVAAGRDISGEVANG
ncbi:MAG TPA: IniB N-terminal domain-containing protein, partial [Pseudonocardiaceae bacterium]|nr:IniB N-terminal domain-containing protein [Pseudonocardiaceae bacterium]